jgi:glycosyltransferase involved in cell wall biosynthesis
VDWRQYFDEYPEAVAREAHACLRLADRLVFASDGTRRLFSDLDGAGRVRTIHYGIDVAAIDEFKRVHSAAAVRAALGLSPEDRVVSVVGTTCERKGQMDFVQAVMKLRSAHPRLRGYVVGARPGAYLRGLEDLIRRHDLAFVTLVPETKDVFQYYRATDVFVCSSYEESFPVVNLEAMAFGLPIVSTDVFGIPEAITDGHDGLLVKPGGVDSLAAAIGRVLGDPGLARRLGEAAYATVTTRFTRQHMVDDYEEVFADCLAPR